jgi:hypothetical protein
LNAGSDGIDQIWCIDCRVVVPAKAGATVTLFANPVESTQTKNRTLQGGTVLVPCVAPFPNPCDGQFVQMDVEGVATP